MASNLKISTQKLLSSLAEGEKDSRDDLEEDSLIMQHELALVFAKNKHFEINQALYAAEGLTQAGRVLSQIELAVALIAVASSFATSETVRHKILEDTFSIIRDASKTLQAAIKEYQKKEDGNNEDE